MTHLGQEITSARQSVHCLLRLDALTALPFQQLAARPQRDQLNQGGVGKSLERRKSGLNKRLM
jgi:hypothetical protein